MALEVLLESWIEAVSGLVSGLQGLGTKPGVTKKNGKLLKGRYYLGTVWMVDQVTPFQSTILLRISQAGCCSHGESCTVMDRGKS